MLGAGAIITPTSPSHSELGEPLQMLAPGHPLRQASDVGDLGLWPGHWGFSKVLQVTVMGSPSPKRNDFSGSPDWVLPPSLDSPGLLGV